MSKEQELEGAGSGAGSRVHASPTRQRYDEYAADTVGHNAFHGSLTGAARELAAAINAPKSSVTVSKLLAERVKGSEVLIARVESIKAGRPSNVLHKDASDELAREIIGDSHWSPLLQAIISRKKSAVKHLLTSYQLTETINVFVVEITVDVLKAAARWGEPDVFQWMLVYRQGYVGTGVAQQRGFDIHVCDNEKRTFLHWLCMQQVATAGRMVDRFLQEEPDMDAEDDMGNTPLHLAVMRGSAAVVTALVAHHANVQAGNKHGATPLHLAFARAERRVATVLLNAHADVDTSDEYGRTALHVAFHARVAAMNRADRVSRNTMQATSMVGQGSDRRLWHIGSADHFAEERVAELKTMHEIAEFVDELDSLVELAISFNADLMANDNAGEPAFPVRARMHWYGRVHAELETIMRNAKQDGYNHSIFKDPRTQLAINTIWIQRLRCKKLCWLLMWVLILLGMMWVSVDETGRDQVLVHAFYKQVEFAFLNEPWGTVFEETYADIETADDFWAWMETALRASVYAQSEDRPKFRIAHNLTSLEESGGPINSFNYLLGRPRLRTLRSIPCAEDETFTLSDEFLESPIHEAVCMPWLSEADVDTTDLNLGAKARFEYHDADVPDYPGLTQYFQGDGQSIKLPRHAPEYDKLVQTMKNKHFLDMNTRFVILELSIYNPTQNLFAAVRMGIDMPNVGGLFPTSEIQVIKLLNYVTPRDLNRLFLEITLVVVFFIYYVFEIRSMCRSIPRKAERKLHSTIKIPFPSLSRGTGSVGQQEQFFMIGSYVAHFDMKDTGFIIPPYFVDVFNMMDLALFVNIIIVIGLHVIHHFLSLEIQWSQEDNETLFVNIFDIANIAETKTYFFGSMWLIACIKTLEFLRINRDLSTFILIIRGMLYRLGSFFVVLIVVLFAFSGWQYIAFGVQHDSSPTVLLMLMSVFGDTLGGIDMYTNLHHPRFWLGPVISIMVAVVLVILLFNLLIAVMSEEYEETKDKAGAIWAHTQYRLLRVDGVDAPHNFKNGHVGSTRTLLAEQVLRSSSKKQRKVAPRNGDVVVVKARTEPAEHPHVVAMA